ncbi:MAG: MmgE/PrpD family protein [Alphaproteobacteria bacterium]
MVHPVGDRMAAFIAAARDREYDAAVIGEAKRCLVDWVGVAMGAVDEPVSRATVETALSWRAEGRGRIFRGPLTTPALAALCNGTMGHAFDFDDTRGHAPSHLGSPTWSAVLALAGELDCDGATALNAFITGYEISAVLGDGNFGNRMQAAGFHPTSVFGRLSAAAAASVLLGHDAEQAGHALGVAATTAGGLTTSFGTMGKPLHSGRAAMDGILAAQLASRGFAAARHAFDTAGGFADTFVQTEHFEFSGLAFTAGQSLFDNSYKPYACGKLIHPHIDAARKLRDAVAGRAVAHIRCQVAEISTRLVGKPLPVTSLEGKFSVAFCIALALEGHPVMPRDFAPDRVGDPRLRALMERVELSVNPALERYASILDITLEDGDILHAEVPRSLGNPDNPMSREDIDAKFHALVEPVLGDRAAALHDALVTVEEPGKLSRVLDLIA